MSVRSTRRADAALHPVVNSFLGKSYETTCRMRILSIFLSDTTSEDDLLLDTDSAYTLEQYKHRRSQCQVRNFREATDSGDFAKMRTMFSEGFKGHCSTWQTATELEINMLLHAPPTDSFTTSDNFPVLPHTTFTHIINKKGSTRQDRGSLGRFTSRMIRQTGPAPTHRNVLKHALSDVAMVNSLYVVGEFSVDARLFAQKAVQLERSLTFLLARQRRRQDMDNLGVNDIVQYAFLGFPIRKDILNDRAMEIFKLVTRDDFPLIHDLANGRRFILLSCQNDPAFLTAANTEGIIELNQKVDGLNQKVDDLTPTVGDMNSKLNVLMDHLRLEIPSSKLKLSKPEFFKSEPFSEPGPSSG